MCHARITQEEVQAAETDELINKIYDGSIDKLFAALIGSRRLSAEQIGRLKKMVEENGSDSIDPVQGKIAAAEKRK